MERRTLMILMILILSTVAWAEDAKKVTPKWEDQPTGIKRLFEQQAPNWVKIGDKLWCVEVMKEAKKRAKRGKGDAYSDVSAPWFYEPISGTRCRWIGEVYKHMKLDAPEGYEVLEGRVVGPIDNGFWLNQPKGDAFFIYCTKDQPANKTHMMVIGKKADKKFINNGTKWLSYDVIPFDQAFKKVSSHDLFTYFADNQIKQFPVWRVMPNRERDGFDWKNYTKPVRIVK